MSSTGPSSSAGKRRQLVCALDLQRERAGAQDHPAGQRQPRLGRVGRADRRDQRPRAGVDRFGETVGAGKPRSGMAVVAHAEHDEIGGQRQGGDARLGRGEFLVRRQARIGERSELRAPRRGRAAASRAPAARSSAGCRRATRRSSASVTATRDQSIGCVEQRVEIALRRRSAGDDEQRHAARLDRRRAASPPSSRAKAGASSAPSANSRRAGAVSIIRTPRSRCGRRARSARSRRRAPGARGIGTRRLRRRGPRPRGSDR